jgi:hypothetical protein
MKATQILYLLIFVGIIYWIVTSTQLLDFSKEGFEGMSQSSEPVIPKGLKPTSLKTEAMPNPMTLDKLPFGEYGQMASTGSYQYKDPSLLPAELSQMLKLSTDIRTFLIFEGVSVTDSSDPSVQLPLTQLRADSQKLQSEISVLEKNPGINSQLTQQDLADIEGSLMFLQRKVRLFQTSGVINTEGFENPTSGKTTAKLTDVVSLQERIHGAILNLSTSGTIDAVVQSRIQALENMYTAITEIITSVNNGSISQSDIPLYKEDIDTILPNLENTSKNINTLFNQKSGKKLSIIEEKLSKLVGEENVKSVFKKIKDNGTFRVNVELGYNTVSKKPVSPKKTSVSRLQAGRGAGAGSGPEDISGTGSDIELNVIGQPMSVNSAYDTSTQGMDDRAANKSKPSKFDWKKRAQSICEQVRLRGLDPEDFGCIATGSLMSPAYSWRGHSKMVCGRLAATMDPNLPIACGCPPNNWKGWNL